MRGGKGTSHIHGVLRGIERKTKEKAKVEKFQGNLQEIVEKAFLYDRIMKELEDWEVEEYRRCSCQVPSCPDNEVTRIPLSVYDIDWDEVMRRLANPFAYSTKEFKTKTGGMIVRKK